MAFLIAVTAVFLVVGIAGTVLITVIYEKTPINPYLPALAVWLLGFLYYAYYKTRLLIQNIAHDPIGQALALYIMGIAVISSCISWAIAEIWTRKKGIARMKMRKLVIMLNIFTIVIPIIYLFIVSIIWYLSMK